MNDLQEVYQNGLETEALKFHSSVKNIHSLAKPDLVELKSALASSISITSIIKVVSLFLGYEPKSANESYAESSRRLLAEPKFLNSLTSFNLESVVTAPMSRIEEIMKDVDPIPNLKTALVFYNWVKAVQNFYADYQVALLPRSKQIKELKRFMDDVESSIEKGETKLAGLEPIMQSMIQRFDEIMKRKDECSMLFRESELQFKASQVIKASLKTSKDRMVDSLRDKSDEEHLLLAETLVSSGYLTLLGGFPASIRYRALDRWFRYIEKENYFFRRNHYQLASFLCQRPAQDMVAGIDIAYDAFLFENALVAKHSEHLPVFWDPFNRMIPWILACERDQRFETMGSRDFDFTDKFLNAALRGVRIIINVHEGYVGEIVEEMLKLMSKSGLLFLRVNGDLRPFERSFKVYFICAEPLKAVCGYSWTRHCQLIQAPLTEAGIQSILTDHFLSSMQPFMKEESRKLYIDKANISTRKEVLVNRFIEFATQLSPENLTGGDLFRTLVDNDEQARLLVEQQQSVNLKINERSNKARWFSSLSQSYAKVFMAVHWLHRIHPALYFELSWFLDICSLANRDLQPFDSTLVLAYFRIFVNNLISYIGPGLSRVSILVLLLHISLILEETEGNVDESHVTDALVDFLVNDRLEMNFSHEKLYQKLGSTRPQVSWLTEHVWVKLKTLASCPRLEPFLEYFLDVITRNTNTVTENAWDDLMSSANTLGTSFPGDEGLFKADKMLILSCLRPNSLYTLSLSLVESQFSSRILEQPIDALSARFKLSNFSVPIWIVNESTEDVATIIRLLSVQRGMSNHVVHVFLDLIPVSGISSLQDLILDCMRKGKWLILSNCEDQTEVLNGCDYYIKYLLGSLLERNSNFRLWMISHDAQNMPMFLRQRSIKVFFDNQRDLKAHLTEALHAIEDSLTPTEFRPPALYKKSLFNFLCIYATLKDRGNFITSQFNCTLDVRSDDFNRGLKVFRKDYPSVSSLEQKEGFGRISQVVGDFVFGSQLFDAWDDRLFRALFSKYMEMTWNENDPKLPVLPLKSILESAQKGELVKCMELLRNMPRDEALRPSMFGFGEATQTVIDRAKSHHFRKVLRKYYRHRLYSPLLRLEDSFETVLDTCKQYLSAIKVACTACFNFEKIGIWSTDDKRSICEVSSKKLHLFASKSGKFMENVLRVNIRKYRALLYRVIPSLDGLIAMLDGRMLLDPLGLRMAQEIFDNRLPSEWTQDGIMYPTCLRLSGWITDFAARLSFIVEWQTVRLNPTLQNKGTLVTYDISKLFSPRAFLDAILHDYAASSREPIDTLEYEVSILSGSQTMPPDRGYYISGLHLLEASWDSSKGCLREARHNEPFTTLNCVSVDY